MAVIYPLLLPDSRRGTVMEQFGGWYQKERKLPGSGGGAPGGGTPLPGRFAAGPLAPQAPKPAPPAFVYRPIPYCTAHARCWKPPFLKETRGKEKGAFSAPYLLCGLQMLIKIAQNAADVEKRYKGPGIRFLEDMAQFHSLVLRHDHI